MNKIRRLVRPAYFIVQGGYWMSICVANSYAAVFLQGRGFSNSELGLILALGNISGLLLSPWLASVVDRSRRLGLYHCLWALLCVQALALCGCCMIPGSGLGLSLMYILYMAVVVSINPLNTQLCFELSDWAMPVSYSPARGIGSLCYALMSLALGRLTLSLGSDMLPLAGLFCLLLQAASTGLITAVRLSMGLPLAIQPHKAKDKAEGLSLPAFIAENKRFCFLMLGLALIFFSYNISDFFMINILRSLGGNEADLGKISCFKAMLELPAMLMFSRLTYRFKCSSVCTFAALAFVAKAVLIAISAEVWMLYLANIFQLISFGLMIPALVQYVNLVIDPKDLTKGQALNHGMTTMGGIFASLIGGWLFDSLSISTTLFIAVMISVCGALIVSLSLERQRA